LVILAGNLHAAPLRVCAFTFNSPDELATMKALLPPSEFEFIELTPTQVVAQSAASSARLASPASVDNGPGWLMNRCRPDFGCDIVVYSGEFAGGFFGQYGDSLNVQEIEEASCQARCDGLFHRPREVFLLGCNTLATKNADNRTPREYLQIL